MKMGTMYRSCLVLLVFCVAFLAFLPLIAGDEGSDYLDRKEQDVEKIVAQAIKNARHQCELLTTCANPTNCSQDACSMEDLGGYQCMDVLTNYFCPLYGTTNSSCMKMNFDYGRSHVRVAASTNLNSVDSMLAICSQRQLDPLFKTLSNSIVLSRAYFGGIDGSFRIYPGTPQDAAHCRKFDGRVRPWYRTSTSVVKIVVVLIDIGASMGNNLPPDLGAGTILQAAKIMVKQLLNTLSVQDYVNIIVFDSSRVIQLSPSAVLVQEHNGTEVTDLDPLRAQLAAQKVEGQSRQSNISAAILAAMPNFDSNPLAAKVVIVVSDFVFMNFNSNVTLPTAELSNSRVKVFMYKLKQPNDNDIPLKNSTLVQQLCAVGGHFEPLLKNIDNPLLAFQKYFSYLASLKRILTNGRPQYSQIYPDFEATFGGNIISVSKPVFFEENLVGVAGIIIYIEALGNITDQVKHALGSRVTGYSLAAPYVVLNAANCSLEGATLEPCGSSTAFYSPTGGLCPRADPPRTIQELMCCGTCRAPSGPTRSAHLGKVIGIPVGAAVGLLLAVVLVCGIFIYRRREKNLGPDYPPFPVSNGESDQPLQRHITTSRDDE